MSEKLDSTEVDKRIETARAEATRAKENDEFLRSLTRNDTLVKPIYNPEAFVMRSKARGAAQRGEINQNDCMHPFNYLQQYVDEDPSVKRNGNSVNLFECGVCHMPLWLVDPFGKEKADQ